jgi:hypothetical protein
MQPASPLFELERSILACRQHALPPALPPHPPQDLENRLKPDAPQEPKRSQQPVQAMAFDDDSAIELSYDSMTLATELSYPGYDHGNGYGNGYENGAAAFAETIEVQSNHQTFPAAIDYETRQQPYPQTFEVEQFANEPSPYYNVPIAFEAEQFANEPSPYYNVPIAFDYQPEAFAAGLSDDAYEVESFEAEPVYNPPEPAAFSWSGESQPFETSDSEAFAADLQAILHGEKTYQPELKQAIPKTEEAEAQSASPEASPVNPPPHSATHAIFDDIAQNMAYATSFDLGTLAMEQRFDQFDRQLDREDTQTTVDVTPQAAVQMSDDEWAASLSILKKPEDLVSLLNGKLLKVRSIPPPKTGVPVTSVDVMVQESLEPSKAEMESPQPPKLIKEPINLYTLPAASWVLPLYLKQQPDKSYLIDQNGTAAEKIAAYYLPWNSGEAYAMQLGDTSDYFFTVQLNGCCFMVGGTRSNPLVIHANYDSPRLQPDLTGLTTQKQKEDATFSHQLNRYKLFYGNMAHELINKNLLDSKLPISVFDPAYYLSPTSSSASVFGIRKAGQWTFYYNCRKGDRIVTAELWPNVLT